MAKNEEDPIKVMENRLAAMQRQLDDLRARAVESDKELARAKGYREGVEATMQALRDQRRNDDRDQPGFPFPYGFPFPRSRW